MWIFKQARIFLVLAQKGLDSILLQWRKGQGNASYLIIFFNRNVVGLLVLKMMYCINIINLMS